MAVKCTKRVDGRVGNLVLERDGTTMKASWKIPSLMKDDNNPARAEFLDADMNFLAGPKDKRTSTQVWDVHGSGRPGDARPLSETGYDYFWIKGLGMETSVEKPYDRNRFHPVKPGRTCYRVDFGVHGGNSSGVGGWNANSKTAYGRGSIVWASYAFELPEKPEIEWEFDYESQKGTVTVTAPIDKQSRAERYDMMVKVSVIDVNGKEKVVQKWTSTHPHDKDHPEERDGGEWVKSGIDISSYLRAVTPGKVVTLRCWAYSRGMAGDNPAQDKAVCKSMSVGIPAPATLGKPTVDKKSATGIVRVPVTPGAWTGKVWLERRHGEGGNWETVDGAVDNTDCKALFDSYSAASPVPGEKMYYRVKSQRGDFTPVYSEPVEATCLFTAKPKPVCLATLDIESVTPRKGEGTSFDITVGFTDSTQNEGTEISWSDRYNAWASLEGLHKTEIEGTDSSKKSKKHAKVMTANINQHVEPGTRYYVRARRYRTVDGEKVYSAYDPLPWAKFAQVVTVSAKDDKCGIVSVSTNKAGTIATVVVGISEDFANTGTELSWSESSGAWTSSTATPETAKIADEGRSDDNPRKSDAWPKTRTYTIENLTSGKVYYVKARRYREDGGTETFSPYSKAATIAMESAADDTCQVVSVTPHPSGDGATLAVGVQEDNPNTGTQVEWSSYRQAWQSNEGPESMEARWGLSSTALGTWPKSQQIHLKGLVPGTVYYARVRRFLESDGTTTYGKWSKLASFATVNVTAENDSCGIVSVESAKGGTGATVVVGWTEDNANDATEVSWSDDEGAWRSNKQPETVLADWADAKSRSSDWKSTAAVEIRGLELGTTYFIRARRVLEGDSATYSPYSDTYTLTTPKDRDDASVSCGLVSLEPGADGTSAVAVVGWAGDRTGCEVSWSEDPDAWESTGQPSAFEFEWADDESRSEAWPHTSTVYITGLTEGATCYVKARSYYDGESRTWSAYTSDLSVTPYSAPASVSLAAPEAVAEGSAIECWWSLESEREQTEWYLHRSDQPNKALASGTGSLCRASVPPEQYEGLSSVSFYVRAGCGGGTTVSNEVTVGVAQAPTCSVSAPATCTAQPMSFRVETSDPGATLLCTCASLGVSWEAPDGTEDQLSGDVVWTASLVPSWEEAGDAWAADVEMPVCDLVSGGTYIVRVQAVEGTAGLRSDEATAQFSVDWAHKAAYPEALVETEEATRTARVTLSAPSGSAQGDCYDVYRMTPWGHELVADGLALDANVIDAFCPFGNGDLHYRVALRTPDGDVSFRDFPYSLDVNLLRFDWNGRFAEFPFNVDLGRSMSKDFEARGHADGTVGGYWDKSVTVSGNYETEVVKLTDAESMRLANELGDWAGPVFARDGHGNAFQCDVQLKSASVSHRSGAAALSFGVTAVALTDDFYTQGGKGA